MAASSSLSSDNFDGEVKIIFTGSSESKVFYLHRLRAFLHDLAKKNFTEESKLDIAPGKLK